MVQPDLFQLINNAVLDLQSSDLQSYTRPVKTLARLIQEPSLDAINQQLIDGLDLDAFLAESLKSQGGMAGSARLAWPDDRDKGIGLEWLLIRRFADDPDFMVNFGYTYFYGGSRVMAGIHNITRQMIIPFARDYKSYVIAHGNTQPKLVMPMSYKVFIVHGHDDGARQSVARFLEKIGFEPVILQEQANRGRTIIEKFEEHGDVGFAVVLLTPDDEGRAKGGDLQPRARQNVVLELGYFIGRLGRHKVCALKSCDLELPSDYQGVLWETMDVGGGWRLSLARELKAAGYEVDLNRAF